MKKILLTFLMLTLIFGNSAINYSWAQEETGDQNSEDVLKKTQEDIMLVGASGVVGAVLGLSTLSFVETPSRHIYNIWTGAALGIIAGVIYVAYNSAQRGSEDLQSSMNFNSSERLAWHYEKTRISSSPENQLGTQFFQLSF
jgi:hypothetical protein